MAELTLDKTLVGCLDSLSETTAIRDGSGRIFGFFVPAADATLLWPAMDGCPYTVEELNRFRQETGGVPLSEIWRKLGAV